MYYVQFFSRNLVGVLDEALGSDSIFCLDGRFNIDNMIIHAKERIEKLSRVQNYEFFEIRRGNLKHYQVLYRNFSQKC